MVAKAGRKKGSLGKNNRNIRKQYCVSASDEKKITEAAEIIGTKPATLAHVFVMNWVNRVIAEKALINAAIQIGKTATGHEALMAYLEKVDKGRK